MTFELNDLVENLISNKYTVVSRERFDMIERHTDNIRKLDGDIVECGVWKGGMSIFLTKVFDTKTIWVVDSFEGFQEPTKGKYFYNNERHKFGEMAIGLDEVKHNFNTFDCLNERVKFIKGYVKDTLEPNSCPINKIALLRIDVDAYSATLETLEYLFDKVVPGGYIVFDDTCLVETFEAVKMFFSQRDIPLTLRMPNNDVIHTDEPITCGMYFIKQ